MPRVWPRASTSEAETAFREGEQLLARFTEQTAMAQKLHSQTKEKQDIAKKKQELAAKTEPASNGSKKLKAPFGDVFKRRTQVAQATQEAGLAQKQTRTLREQLNRKQHKPSCSYYQV